MAKKNFRRGIPNTYNSQRFRSLLEARWASFFDALGWPWEYEPFELDGYIPDFVLNLHEPLLVEIKPALKLVELEPHQDKIEKSGWDREALLVGATWHRSALWLSSATPGLLAEQLGDESGELQMSFDEAIFFRCNDCKQISIHHAEHSYACRVSGCYDGTGHLGDLPFEEIVAVWREASNRVQWNRSEST